MKNKQSELLTQFYKAYLAWVVAGTPIDGSGFKSNYGLCANLCNLITSNDAYQLVFEEMDEQFHEDGLNPLYPFNKDSADYIQDSDKHAHHLNQGNNHDSSLQQ